MIQITEGRRALSEGFSVKVLASDVWTSIIRAVVNRRRPGEVRDAIIAFLRERRGEATVAEIRQAVVEAVGDVPPSSVRSYLNLNTPATFVRTGRGRYRLAG
ncbi:MAG: hypothetical protein WD739_11090 [Actinomycetota bacterium]